MSQPTSASQQTTLQNQQSDAQLDEYGTESSHEAEFATSVNIGLVGSQDRSQGRDRSREDDARDVVDTIRRQIEPES